MNKLLEFSSHGVYEWSNADPKELSHLYPRSLFYLDTDNLVYLIKGERNQGKISELERIKHKLDIRGGLHIPNYDDYNKLINEMINKLVLEREKEYIKKDIQNTNLLILKYTYNNVINLLLNYHLKYLTIKTVKYNQTLKLIPSYKFYGYIKNWYPFDYERLYDGNCEIHFLKYSRIKKAERKLEKCLKK